MTRVMMMIINLVIRNITLQGSDVPLLSM